MQAALGRVLHRLGGQRARKHQSPSPLRHDGDADADLDVHRTADQNGDVQAQTAALHLHNGPARPLPTAMQQASGQATPASSNTTHPAAAEAFVLLADHVPGHYTLQVNPTASPQRPPATSTAASVMRRKPSAATSAVSTSPAAAAHSLRRPASRLPFTPATTQTPPAAAAEGAPLAGMSPAAHQHASANNTPPSSKQAPSLRGQQQHKHTQQRLHGRAATQQSSPHPASGIPSFTPPPRNQPKHNRPASSPAKCRYPSPSPPALCTGAAGSVVPSPAKPLLAHALPPSQPCSTHSHNDAAAVQAAPTPVCAAAGAPGLPSATEPPHLQQEGTAQGVHTPQEGTGEVHGSTADITLNAAAGPNPNADSGSITEPCTAAFTAPGAEAIARASQVQDTKAEEEQEEEQEEEEEDEEESTNNAVAKEEEGGEGMKEDARGKHEGVEEGVQVLRVELHAALEAQSDLQAANKDLELQLSALSAFNRTLKSQLQPAGLKVDVLESLHRQLAASEAALREANTRNKRLSSAAAATTSSARPAAAAQHTALHAAVPGRNCTLDGDFDRLEQALLQKQAQEHAELVRGHQALQSQAAQLQTERDDALALCEVARTELDEVRQQLAGATQAVQALTLDLGCKAQQEQQRLGEAVTVLDGLQTHNVVLAAQVAQQQRELSALFHKKLERDSQVHALKSKLDAALERLHTLHKEREAAEGSTSGLEARLSAVRRRCTALEQALQRERSAREKAEHTVAELEEELRLTALLVARQAQVSASASHGDKSAQSSAREHHQEAHDKSAVSVSGQASTCQRASPAAQLAGDAIAAAITATHATRLADASAARTTAAAQQEIAQVGSTRLFAQQHAPLIAAEALGSSGYGQRRRLSLDIDYPRASASSGNASYNSSNRDVRNGSELRLGPQHSAPGIASITTPCYTDTAQPPASQQQGREDGQARQAAAGGACAVVVLVNAATPAKGAASGQATSVPGPAVMSTLPPDGPESPATAAMPAVPATLMPAHSYSGVGSLPGVDAETTPPPGSCTPDARATKHFSRAPTMATTGVQTTMPLHALIAAAARVYSPAHSTRAHTPRQAHGAEPVSLRRNNNNNNNNNSARQQQQQVQAHKILLMTSPPRPAPVVSAATNRKPHTSALATRLHQAVHSPRAPTISNSAQLNTNNTQLAGAAPPSAAAPPCAPNSAAATTPLMFTPIAAEGESGDITPSPAGCSACGTESIGQGAAGSARKARPRVQHPQRLIASHWDASTRTASQALHRSPPPPAAAAAAAVPLAPSAISSSGRVTHTTRKPKQRDTLMEAEGKEQCVGQPCSAAPHVQGWMHEARPASEPDALSALVPAPCIRYTQGTGDINRAHVSASTPQGVCEQEHEEDEHGKGAVGLLPVSNVWRPNPLFFSSIEGASMAIHALPTSPSALLKDTTAATPPPTTCTGTTPHAASDSADTAAAHNVTDYSQAPAQGGLDSNSSTTGSAHDDVRGGSYQVPPVHVAEAATATPVHTGLGLGSADMHTTVHAPPEGTALTYSHFSLSGLTTARADVITTTKPPSPSSIPPLPLLLAPPLPVPSGTLSMDTTPLHEPHIYYELPPDTMQMPTLAPYQESCVPTCPHPAQWQAAAPCAYTHDSTLHQQPDLVEVQPCSMTSTGADLLGSSQASLAALPQSSQPVNAPHRTSIHQQWGDHHMPVGSISVHDKQQHVSSTLRAVLHQYCPPPASCAPLPLSSSSSSFSSSSSSSSAAAAAASSVGVSAAFASALAQLPPITRNRRSTQSYPESGLSAAHPHQPHPQLQQPKLSVTAGSLADAQALPPRRHSANGAVHTSPAVVHGVESTREGTVVSAAMLGEPAQHAQHDLAMQHHAPALADLVQRMICSPQAHVIGAGARADHVSAPQYGSRGAVQPTAAPLTLLPPHADPIPDCSKSAELEVTPALHTQQRQQASPLAHPSPLHPLGVAATLALTCTSQQRTQRHPLQHRWSAPNAPTRGGTQNQSSCPGVADVAAPAHAVPNATGPMCGAVRAQSAGGVSSSAGGAADSRRVVQPLQLSDLLRPSVRAG